MTPMGTCMICFTRSVFSGVTSTSSSWLAYCRLSQRQPGNLYEREMLWMPPMPLPCSSHSPTTHPSWSSTRKPFTSSGIRTNMHSLICETKTHRVTGSKQTSCVWSALGSLISLMFSDSPSFSCTQPRGTQPSVARRWGVWGVRAACRWVPEGELRWRMLELSVAKSLLVLGGGLLLRAHRHHWGQEVLPRSTEKLRNPHLRIRVALPDGL